jgi:hypothetical protein
LDGSGGGVGWGSGEHLHHEEQGDGGPGGDDAGAEGGVGGGDVRRDGGDDPEGEGQPGHGADPVPVAFVVDHDDRGDDEHPVDAERQGAGHLGAFPVANSQVDHV